jgi:hypothetical protein
VSDAGYALAERILAELAELSPAGPRSAGVGNGRKQGRCFYLDSVALNLHGFYSGLERTSNA